VITMVRQTRADVEREKWITCLHESAHVVFAVMNGRRVRWVTIKPKKMIDSDGSQWISLGRWDTDDKTNVPSSDTTDIDLIKRHVYTTLAGPIIEDMITHEKNGGQDMGIAMALCKHYNLNLDELIEDTTRLVVDRQNKINALAPLLFEHKTLNENQINRAISG